jgi:2-methylisocitrate lyase-like PEP mutase family enzyme
MPKLKDLLARDELLIAPGIYDALSGLVAEQAGAESVYLSGASIAYTRFGRSDVGLVDMTEVAAILAAIAERVTVPIVADGDNGFGNALNVKRTVRSFERAGAAAIQLEDQTLPKRCGHLAGKSLISEGEMVGKLKAACDARDDLLIIARTDAIAVEGFEAALRRAHAYADAGADVIFVEAPETLEQMRAVVASLGGRAPLLANMIEGGRTPACTARELAAMGFRLAIYPGSAARLVARQLADLYRTLLAEGTTRAMQPRMLDFNGLNAVVGTPELLAEAKRYAAGQESP